MRLTGRAALVTGSSRGIGAAIAKRLAADGAKIILHASSDPAKAETVAAAIRGIGGTADIVIGDLRDAEAPISIVRQAFAFHGALDILVCNAGAGGLDRIADLDASTIDQRVAVNLRAPMLSTAEYARLTTSPHGRVIMLSSLATLHPAPGLALYAATKAGLEAFARGAAQELGPRGITVNSVLPGTTRTEMFTDMFTDDRMVKTMSQWTAMGRIGDPEDIADIVAFIASDESRWLTGLSISASGGQITSTANLVGRS